jgi:hypothetical protein
LILQYLQDEGYATSFMTVQDEANVKFAEHQTQRSTFKRMRKAILGMPRPPARPSRSPCPPCHLWRTRSSVSLTRAE